MTAVMGGREGRRAVELERRGEEEEEQEETGGSRGVVLWDLGTAGSVDRFSTCNRERIKTEHLQQEEGENRATAGGSG